MNVEKLEVLKVNLENEYYILIVPNAVEGIREFFLANELVAKVDYMFGCYVADDEEAIEIAVSNADEYEYMYRRELFEREIS